MQNVLYPSDETPIKWIFTPNWLNKRWWRIYVAVNWVFVGSGNGLVANFVANITMTW